MPHRRSKRLVPHFIYPHNAPAAHIHTSRVSHRSVACANTAALWVFFFANVSRVPAQFLPASRSGESSSVSPRLSPDASPTPDYRFSMLSAALPTRPLNSRQQWMGEACVENQRLSTSFIVCFQVGRTTLTRLRNCARFCQVPTPSVARALNSYSDCSHTIATLPSEY